jgi:hypothetical protein
MRTAALITTVNREVKIPRFRFTVHVRVSPFSLPIFADVSFLPVISTRFPAVNHGLYVKRQTSTDDFYLLFVGRLNSKKLQHLTHKNNEHICSSTIYDEPQCSAKVTIL